MTKNEHERERQPAESGAAPETSAADVSADIETLRKKLEESEGRSSTYLDLAQRTQADFLNYKRRIEQERSDFAWAAKADAVKRILPILDDLERAAASVPESLKSTDWAQGVLLIERKMRAGLESEGVKRVEALGKPFDPWSEEAIMEAESDQFPAGTVSAVVRSGYTMDGKVLRPAQVVVSKGSAGTTESATA